MYIQYTYMYTHLQQVAEYDKQNCLREEKTVGVPDKRRMINKFI